MVGGRVWDMVGWKDGLLEPEEGEAFREARKGLVRQFARKCEVPSQYVHSV